MTLDCAQPRVLKLLFRVDEACSALGLGRTSFYEEVKAGRLITVCAAGRTLIHRHDLEAYADARRAEAVAQRQQLH